MNAKDTIRARFAELVPLFIAKGWENPWPGALMKTSGSVTMKLWDEGTVSVESNFVPAANDNITRKVAQLTQEILVTLAELPKREATP